MNAEPNRRFGVCSGTRVADKKFVRWASVVGIEGESAIGLNPDGVGGVAEVKFPFALSLYWRQLTSGGIGEDIVAMGTGPRRRTSRLPPARQRQGGTRSVRSSQTLQVARAGQRVAYVQKPR